MSLRTCLLISDDADDHQSFTEAFQEISPELIVIAVMNQEKALSLISTRKHIPDYIFLDLTSHESDPESFVAELSKIGDLKNVVISVYGTEDELNEFQDENIISFHKEYDYVQLRYILKKIIEGK